MLPLIKLILTSISSIFLKAMAAGLPVPYFGIAGPCERCVWPVKSLRRTPLTSKTHSSLPCCRETAVGVVCVLQWMEYRIWILHFEPGSRLQGVVYSIWVYRTLEVHYTSADFFGCLLLPSCLLLPHTVFFLTASVLGRFFLFQTQVTSHIQEGLIVPFLFF